MPHYLIAQADFDKVKKFKTEKELLEYAKKRGTSVALVAFSGEVRRVETAPTLRPMEESTRASAVGKSKKDGKKKKKDVKKPREKRATGEGETSPEQLLAALEAASEPTAPREIANLLNTDVKSLRVPFTKLRARGQATTSSWGKGAKWSAIAKKPAADLVGPEARS